MADITTTQQIIAYAIGQDPRLKPANANDATIMLKAWQDAIPDGTDFETAQKALIRRARNPSTSPYPITLQELCQGIAEERRRVQRSDVLPRIERKGSPMPDHVRREIVKLVTRNQGEK